MSVILGIDPGKSGAIAALNTDTGMLIGAVDMPVVGAIISAHLLDTAVRELIQAWAAVPLTLAPDAVAVVEDVHAMPKQGVSSVFSFGRALGVVEGVLGAQGWPLRYVSPAKWKRGAGLTTDKDLSRRRAIELWPMSADLFKLKKHDGRAEAALLAHWWWQTNGR